MWIDDEKARMKRMRESLLTTALLKALLHLKLA
jgi:hypothetical protein